jgi:beta-glucosidase
LASVTRPVKALKGFQKISLEQGESKDAEFVIAPEDMSLLDRSLKRVVEPGRFTVMVGSSSEDIHARGHFDVK